MEQLPCIIVEPDKEPDASVIWLHGLGADGHDFEPIVPELYLPEDMAVRFIFPSAPSIPITINNGYVMPAWFDILEPGKEKSFNAAQLLASAAALHGVIDREIEKGIESERILLLGFSQGGAVCIHAGLTYDKPLGGVAGLSTWFPTGDAMEVHPANSKLPLKMCHGSEDPIIDLGLAEIGLEKLKKLGLNPEFKLYVMEHTVVVEEIRDISQWIQGLLAKI